MDKLALEQAKQYISSSENDIYKPCTRPDGEGFRVGVIDSAVYYPTGALLYHAVNEMNDKGWLTLDGALPFDVDRVYSGDIIKYLSQNDTGEYLDFDEDAHFYAVSDAGEEDRKRFEALAEGGDIDIIICLGTSAGIAGKEISQGRIPLLVSFSADPVAAGITSDNERSGIDNIWAQIPTSGYENQITLTKSVFDFKNMGMVYYDEATAGLKEYRRAAENAGAEISALKMDDDSISAGNSEEYYEEYKKNILKLVDGNNIDSFMINSGMIGDEEKAEEICDMLYDRNIPVFGQSGDEFTQLGSPLMSVTFDPKDHAAFLVNTMAGVLNGRSPGEMNQKNTSPFHISVNKSAADRLGIRLNDSIIEYADRIYYKK